MATKQLKKVNFTDLGMDKIYKIIKTDKNTEDIEIYNPNEKQRKEIIQMIIEGKDKDIFITSEQVILKLIPMLTNINFNIKEDDKDEIQRILNSPSKILSEVVVILTELIQKVVDDFVTVVEEIEKMPKDAVNKLLKNSEETKEKDTK